jgi:hypothetical protein
MSNLARTLDHLRPIQIAVGVKIGRGQHGCVARQTIFSFAHQTLLPVCGGRRDARRGSFGSRHVSRLLCVSSGGGYPEADDVRHQDLLDFLRAEIWPRTHDSAPITKQDREAMLGYNFKGFSP